MGYIPREAEPTLRKMAGQFKAVLVTGARQVGKTTMARHVLGDGYGYVSLDRASDRESALADPSAFLDDHPAPVIIDEIQKAPSLFEEIKARVDESDARGSYVLTGSQGLRLMKGVRDSLAGRVGVLEMAGLSVRERSGSGRVGPHAPGDGWRRASGERPADTWEAIWRGGAPALADPSADWDMHWSSYVSTYVERDVKDVLDVRDAERFYRFVRLLAARTGGILNYSDLSRDAGIDSKTAKAWTSVLESSGIVRLLEPVSANVTKALTKSPKVYFMDTGLACHLAGMVTPEAVRRGPMAGALFETFAVTEIVKTYLNSGLRTEGRFGYLRLATGRKKEVDVVIEDGLRLCPIEVKAKREPNASDAENLGIVAGLGPYEPGPGEVVCDAGDPYSLARGVRAVSVWDI